MTDQGKFIEIQGTAESKPFSKDNIGSLLSLAEEGIKELFQAQQSALERLKQR
jgi:ribonuclease PH